MNAGIVLLVGDNAAERSELGMILTRHGGFVVVEVGSADEARLRVGDLAPEALVASMLDIGPLATALSEMINGDPTLLGIPLVLLADNLDAESRKRAWGLGAAALLQNPVDAGEFSGCVRAVVAAHRTRSEPASGGRYAMESVRQVQELLVHTLDSAAPGSEERGNEVAAAALILAREFGVEEHLLEDMVLAARLHELGRIVAPGRGRPGEGAPTGRTLMASAVLLRQVEVFRGAAHLVEAMGANWDGTGTPADLQRGQIPLRARLLRVVVDLLSAVREHAREGDASLATAAMALSIQSGTRYDPAVIAALDVLVAAEESGTLRPEGSHVQVPDLCEGMILAADLHTASGVKLLSAGAVLTSQSLQLIRRRDAIDPIVHGVIILSSGR
ncbi:MAG: HD domain-containing phosphohydrolase [Gemmatimonadota bacterium]